MKITSTGVAPIIVTDRAPGSGATAAAPAAAAAPALQSAVLHPAQQALAALPEIDPAKVQALRDALAKGEIRFDAERLAALVQRFHGGR